MTNSEPQLDIAPEHRRTKHVLITGASSGIGQATTRALSSRGYAVFATYRDQRDRAALAELPNVLPVSLDVSDPDQIRRAIAGIDETVGGEGLYAVINNAGMAYTAPFEYAQLDRVREIIDVNLIAPYLVAQACIPLLRRYNEAHSERSRVVNVASWAGLWASPYIGFYNASKYGVIGLTESMYYDLGLLGIHTVLAVPGVTKTPLLKETSASATASLDSMPPEGQDRYRPYLEHFTSMSNSSDGLSFPRTPAQVADKIVKIVDTGKPRFKYNLAADAKVVDGLVTRFLPFRARAALNRRMYRLDQPRARADRGRSPQPSR
ncbi:MAG: short-chain dehydrogenase/reductase [Frankiales bacterium]|nr:short-chain dehydrogenase/reductase [Frankiales bacterium]